MTATPVIATRQPYVLAAFRKWLAAVAFLQVLTLLPGWCANAVAQGLYIDKPLPLYLERPIVTLFLSGEMDQSSQKSPTSEGERERLRRELELNIYTRGFIYHPALMTYRLRLRPEFRWDDTETQGSESSGKSQFLSYDIQTTWLREKPYTVTLGARRQRSEFSSLLAADSVSESTNYSAGLQLKSTWLPTSISYNKDDNDASGYYASATSDERWRLYSEFKKTNSSTDLEMEQRSYSRSIGGGSNPSELFRLRLANRYSWGDGDRLMSSLGYSESNRSDQSSRMVSINSRLNLQHKRNLDSYYSADYRRRDDDDRFGRSAQFSAGLRHQLYENLSTGVNVSGTNNEAESGDASSYGGGLNFTYTRRVPWGRIRVFGSRERSNRDDRREAMFVSSQNESHQFEGITTSIFLNEINIDTASILVTDVTGLIAYVPGIDYDVDVLGSATIITRSSFGGIAEDETVLVDYLYTPNPPAKTIRYGSGGGVGLSLGKYFTIAYGVRRSDERVIEGTPPEFPLDSESRRLSAQLEVGNSVTTFEADEIISARAPRKIRSISERLHFRPGKAVSLSLSAAYARTEFKDTGEIAKGLGYSAGLSWRLGRWGNLKVGASIRESESSVRRQEQKGIDAEYRWRFGAWSSFLRLRKQDKVNEFEDIEWDQQTVYFQTSRRFN